jgi:flagellar hook protein FlgE
MMSGLGRSGFSCFEFWAAAVAPAGATGSAPAGRAAVGKTTPASPGSACLELVDEFTRLIVVHPRYSANARVITTTDEMLNELVRINR